jgi:chromosome segregation protein
VQLDQEVDRLTATEEGQRADLQTAERKLELTNTEIRRLRQQDFELVADLDAMREQLQRDKGRLSSLEALQEAALGRVSEAASRWLAQENRDQRPRLAAQLQVESGWERAVEAVLGGYLNAIGTADLESLTPHLDVLSDSGLAILEESQQPLADAASVNGMQLLASKIHAPASARKLLEGVFAADSLELALQQRKALAIGQSIVTPEGVHITRNALRTHRSDDPQLGVIARGEEIEQLQGSVARLTRDSDAAGQRLADVRASLEALEAELVLNQSLVHELQSGHAEARAQLQALRTRRDELRQRISALEADTAALQDERHSISQAMQEAQRRLDGASAEKASRSEAQALLHSNRGQHIERLQSAREQAERDRENVKEIAIMLESRKSSQQSASAALERVQAQRKYLVDRRAELARRIAELEQPLADERASLELQLDERLQVEDSLARARAAVESCEHSVREAESRRVDAQQAVNAARDEVSNARMAAREIEVRAETVRDQFNASGLDHESLVAELSEEANVQDWSEKLESTGRKIARLGAINLAAIDEFEEKSERKEYLDKQFEDLRESLETLEAAIRKIDGETRTRFRDTFSRANEGLSELFPRLFGGGQAYLELDSDDLLSAGVTVMARPPGKRISTIHLMSGGEKALTAVALVFAIFKLNPAPFCLLDEVDAPLDDANVGRFSDIVREMSDTVQFVLITHNKTTMEAMNQLAGVTMHEPGVSRLVAVDIDEAVQLAAM